VRGRWLEDLTWSEAAAWRDRGTVVLIPIGAVSKEHGHALPLCTDYLLARGLTERVLEELPILAAPVLSVGYYPSFRHYPGSQHLRPETFAMLIEDVLAGFLDQGFTDLAILNTGVSTTPVLRVVLREFYEKTGAAVHVADITALGHASDPLLEQKLGGHGDEHETSMILALDETRVRRDRLVCDYGNELERPKTVFYRPSVFCGDPASGADYSATGIRGDATLASVDKGRAVLDAMTADLVGGLETLFPAQIAACLREPLP
jgi:creatinine amidohydrolase/Fe(II)-dependent formamide hydrolase-like protein